MPKRCRFTPLAAITLCSALNAACVASPEDVARLSADHSLDQRSDRGLVEAIVSLDGSAIARGPNDFSIRLRAAESQAFSVMVKRSAPSVSIYS